MRKAMLLLLTLVTVGPSALAQYPLGVIIESIGMETTQDSAKATVHLVNVSDKGVVYVEVALFLPDGNQVQSIGRGFSPNPMLPGATLDVDFSERKSSVPGQAIELQPVVELVIYEDGTTELLNNNRRPLNDRIAWKKAELVGDQKVIDTINQVIAEHVEHPSEHAASLLQAIVDQQKDGQKNDYGDTLQSAIQNLTGLARSPYCVTKGWDWEAQMMHTIVKIHADEIASETAHLEKLSIGVHD